MTNGESSYRRYLDGDDEGIVELIRDYKDGLTFYINSIVNNYGLAEELMQDTFTKLAIKKPHFSGRSNFKTWIYAIGRNLAYDHIRRSKRMGSVPLDEVDNYIDTTEGVEAEYLQTEKKLEVRRAMDKLGKDYVQALWLVYFENFSYREAARIMRKTDKQFDNLIYRAKKSLKSELEKGGIFYEGL